ARIGVDALIQPVGKDRDGAMASPSSLDAVGWFNRGPAPGQSGDAAIDGHYGLPQEAAVFRTLRLLRPGDEAQVVWPDVRTVGFAHEGARVVIADIDDAQSKKVEKEAPSGTITARHTDVTDWESVTSMVEYVKSAMGDVDILVNCAGWTIDRLFLEKPRSEW